MYGTVGTGADDAASATGAGSTGMAATGTADCDATAAKVTANGGTLQMGPEDAEGVGRLAICVDPAGADFVVLTPAAPAS